MTEIAQAFAQCAIREPTKDLQQQFQMKAIQSLQQAIRLGFKDVVFLESEIDYRPLANLPEFQTLVKEIKALEASSLLNKSAETR